MKKNQNKKSSGKQNKSQNSNKKHKFIPLCFNTCVNWDINISYCHNKITYSSYPLKSKNLFFPTLEKSILNFLYLKEKENNFLEEKNNLIKLSNSLLNNEENSENNNNNENNEIQNKNNINNNINSNTKDNINNNINELKNLKFPINNKSFSYMIIDANLSIKENLNNIFFLEIELNNNNSKHFLINNENVNREIFFNINGRIHDAPLFTSDLKFSVELRKFIKSIQKRLDTYKSEIIQLEKENKFTENHIKNNFFSKVIMSTNLAIEFTKNFNNTNNNNNSNNNNNNNEKNNNNKENNNNSNNNNNNNNNNNFKNSGKKFSETFLTNFNSIVNSNITVNKIFLELCIPKIYINNGLALEIYNKNKIKEIEIDKFEKNNFNSNYSNIPLNLNNNNTLYNKSSLKDKPIKIPPITTNSITTASNTTITNNTTNINKNKFDFSSDFFIKDKRYNSPSYDNTTKKNFSYIQNNPNYLSPDFLTMNNNIFNNNNNFNNNLSYINTSGSNSIYYVQNNIFNNNNNNNFNNNNYNNNNIYGPLSPKFNKNNNNNNNMNYYQNLSRNNMISDFDISNNGSIYQRNFSESFENPFSYHNNSARSHYHYYNNYCNLSNQANLSNRSYGNNKPFDDYIFFNNKNNYLSPRTVYNFKFNENYFNNINNSIFSINNNNNSQKINLENNLNNNNIIDNNKMQKFYEVNNHIKKMKIIEDKKISYFKEHFDGLSNFLIFIKACTPYLNFKHINNNNNKIDIKIDKFFSSFYKKSISGFKLNYFKNFDQLVMITYNMTLSSMELYINEKEVILHIIKNLIKKNVLIYSNNVIISNNNIINDNLIQLIENAFDNSNENNNNNEFNHLEFFPFETNSCFKIILSNLTNLVIEYYENKPPHLRNLFIENINNIFDYLNINEYSLNIFSNKSFFSILFTPFKSQDNIFLQTSFLTYYQFKYNNINNNNNNNNNNYVEIPIIGVLPIKFKINLFLEKINQNFNDYTLLQKNIKNVSNNILMYTNKVSDDVEYYLKNNNNNYI